LDEQRRVAGLPVPHEPPELLLVGKLPLRRLLLEGPEGAKLTLGGDEPFDGGGTGGPDQLILEIFDADVKTEVFHPGAREVGAEAGALESAPKVVLLRGVAEARQPHVQPLRAEQLQEPADRLRAAHRHDGDALGLEVTTAPLGERFEGPLVADPLDEHGGVRVVVHHDHRVWRSDLGRFSIRGMNGSPTAVLYDIHGNLAALEAVLAEAETEGATSYVLGGDYATFGPWPRETTERLERVPATIRIRGNVDRWLRERPEVPEEQQELVTTAVTAAREALGPALADRLYGLPERAELDGVLVCHGSPLSDIETFAPDPQPGEEGMLVGEAHRTILFGHSHQQFERPGPNGTLLVNPGSVGAPLDGDPRAAWAVYENGTFDFRRTDYDRERAAAQMRSLGEWTEPILPRIEYGLNEAP
jgi:predicted phosphodiesterase